MIMGLITPVLVPYPHNLILGQAWKGHDTVALGWKARFRKKRMVLHPTSNPCNSCVTKLGSFSCCSAIAPCYIVGPHSTVSNVFFSMKLYYVQHLVAFRPLHSVAGTLSVLLDTVHNFSMIRNKLSLLVPPVYQCKQGHQTLSTGPCILMYSKSKSTYLLFYYTDHIWHVTLHALSYLPLKGWLLLQLNAL